MPALRVPTHGSGSAYARILLAAMPLLLLTVPTASGARAADVTAKPASSTSKIASVPVPPSKVGKFAQGHLPIVFTANGGQAPASVLYEARGAGLDVLLGKTEVTLLHEVPHAAPARNDGGKAKASFGGSSMAPAADPGTFTVDRQTIEFVGENPDVAIEPLDQQTGKASYFRGHDPKRWSTGLSTYARVRYRNLYPGIDLIFYSANGSLEYDFTVAAGADPALIRMRLNGGDPIQLTADGALRVGTGIEAVLHRPLLYQNLGNGKKMIEGRFVSIDAETVGFNFAGYDKSKTLVIDPAVNLVYSTFMGGQHDDVSYGIDVDASGNAYITGYSASQDFPVTGNAYQTTRMAIGTYTYDVVVMKFDPSGNLLYSTFLGGSQTDQGLAIVVDPSGDAWVGGGTYSPDFPVTSGAFQTTYGGGKDGFLAEISPDGSSLLYSTYLGGTGDEYIGSLILNSDGSLWMSGGASAAGLPASTNAAQPKPNGADNYFVGKVTFNQSGIMQIPYLTFIGGSNNNEEAFWGSLALDSSGDVYLAGGTQSGDFPVTSNAYQKPFPLSDGCYAGTTPNSIPTLTKFSPDLSQMLYSTVIGGPTEALGGGEPDCNQFALSIHLDAQGDIWLTGTTGMSDFPVTSNAIQKQLGTNGMAGVDDFVVEMSPDGTKELYGTFIGGTAYDYAGRSAWDANNNIWMSGTSQSTDFPVTSNALQPANAGGFDATLTELSPDGTKILYSTYLGGSGDDALDGNGTIAIDPAGNIHLAGETGSTNFPITATAFQSVWANGDAGADSADMFYTVLGSGIIGSVGPTSGGNTGDTTITVTGAGFEAGATCDLVLNGVTITATSTTVNATGTSITCTFALNGATAGAYNVVIADPDGTTFTKTAAFTVQSGGQPTIWSNIIGRPKIRTNTESTFYVTYGNSGTVDAYGVPITLELPSTFALDIPTADASTVNASDLYYTDSTDGSQFIQFVAPHLAPGETVSIPLQVTDATDGDTWAVGITSGNAAYSSISAAQTGLTNLAIGTSCAAASGSLQDCTGLDAANFVSLVLGEFTDMGTQEGFTFNTAQATTSFTQYYAAAVADSINQSAGSPSQLSGNVRSASTRPRPDLGVTVSCCSDIGVTPNNGPNGNITYTYNGLPSVTTIPAVGNSPLVKNPETGPLAKQLINKLQDAITGQIFNSPQNLCTAAAALSGAQGTYTGQYQKNCGACNSGIQICQNSYGCNFNPGGTNIIQGLPYPVNCNPNNPVACKSRKKGKIAFELRPRPGFDPSPRDSGGDGCDGGGTGGSIDPNYKSGSVGDGSTSQFVSGSNALSYNVGFENEPTATLPAAQVVVTDQLDPTKVDLTTLTLGTIAFGTNTINLPGGTANYNTTYNLNSSLSVRIQGSLDASTGLLKWTFTSIDPSTGLPPSDPTVGFLPPDTDGIVGQGSVIFNVTPKSGQSTGAGITNTATVVFDSNAPIVTPTWLNTLDVTPPVSSVTKLPAAETTTAATDAFTVSWSGTDAGSGVGTYTIYVSDNGGAFNVWQNAVTTTSASFTGTTGHTYGFYSIATDNVGNVEAAKTQADTSTEVEAPQPPDFTVAPAIATVTVSAGSSGNVTINITPENGFNQAVTFSCSGLPAKSSCSFSPASVTPSGTTVSTTTMTITTTGTTAHSVPPFPWTAGTVATALLLLPFVRRKRRTAWMIVFVCAAGISMALAGCGGGGPPAVPGTPTGTSTVTVTATSGSGTSALTHTTTVTLTVQ
jgi:hypothetical protein